MQIIHGEFHYVLGEKSAGHVYAACVFLFGYDPFWINFMIYPHNLFIQNVRMLFKCIDKIFCPECNAAYFSPHFHRFPITHVFKHIFDCHPITSLHCRFTLQLLLLLLMSAKLCGKDRP